MVLHPVSAAFHDLRNLELLVSNSTDGIIVFQPNQDIIWANGAALAMHKVESVHELGRSVMEYHANFRVMFRGPRKGSSGEAQISGDGRSPVPDMIMELTHADGHNGTVSYRARYQSLTDESGGVRSVALVLSRLEEDAAGRMAELSAVVDSLPQAAAILRLQDNHLLKANHSFLRLVGLGAGAAASEIAAALEPASLSNRDDVVGRQGGRSFSLSLRARRDEVASPVRVQVSGVAVTYEGQSCLLLTDSGECAAPSPAVSASVLPKSRQTSPGAANVVGICAVMPSPFLVLDHEMRVIDASQAFLDWLYLPRAAVTGLPIHRLMPQDTADRFRRHTWHNLAHINETSQAEIQFIKTSGEVVDALLSTKADFDDEGRLVAVFASAVDITGSKRSEDMLAQMFALAPVPMLITRFEDQRVLDANNAFLHATDRNSQGVVGHTIDELGIFESKADKHKFEITVRGGGQVQSQQTRVKDAHGQFLACMLYGSKIHAFGQTCLLLIVHDISDRRRDEAQLYEAIQMVMKDTSWFSRSVIEKLAALRSPPRNDGLPVALDELTPRERDVLVLISHGLADPEIAAKLGLTRSTIRNHVTTLYSKIGVHSRSSAIIWARERGINIEYSLHRRKGSGIAAYKPSSSRQLTWRKDAEAAAGGSGADRAGA